MTLRGHHIHHVAWKACALSTSPPPAVGIVPCKHSGGLGSVARDSGHSTSLPEPLCFRGSTRGHPALGMVLSGNCQSLRLPAGLCRYFLLAAFSLPSPPSPPEGFSVWLTLVLLCSILTLA